MDKLRRLSLYWADYQPRQLRTHRLAREWMEAGVSPQDATEWTNLGMLPEEAAPHIASGLTPAMYREMDDHAQQTAGGPDELAAQRIRQMVDAGEIVDPGQVIRVQDPTDPTREIIAIRDDG